MSSFVAKCCAWNENSYIFQCKSLICASKFHQFWTLNRFVFSSNLQQFCLQTVETNVRQNQQKVCELLRTSLDSVVILLLLQTETITFKHTNIYIGLTVFSYEESFRSTNICQQEWICFNRSVSLIIDHPSQAYEESCDRVKHRQHPDGVSSHS